MAQCPVYTQCLEQQIWDEKGELVKKSKHDQPNDAVGYFITKMFPIVKRTVGRAGWGVKNGPPYY